MWRLNLLRQWCKLPLFRVVRQTSNWYVSVKMHTDALSCILTGEQSGSSGGTICSSAGIWRRQMKPCQSCICDSLTPASGQPKLFMTYPLMLPQPTMLNSQCTILTCINPELIRPCLLWHRVWTVLWLLHSSTDALERRLFQVWMSE